jgi:ZIP family zinc transporter
MDSIFEPFLLSLIAGVATGIGGLLAILLREVSDRGMAFSMGFSSGVMLLVAFNDLFLEAASLLTHLELIIAFSLGAILIMILDLTIPHIELTMRRNKEEDIEVSRTSVGPRRLRFRARLKEQERGRLFRTGLLLAIGITIHNLPEGFVVTAGYVYMPKLGLIIAVAIMLHNIPEGIVTAIPLMMSGTKPSKVGILTLISGLAEPIAALIGALAFSIVGTRNIIGSSLAFAAGVMTYITADELIPVAHEYGHKHTVSVGLLMGIMFALLIDVILSYG